MIIHWLLESWWSIPLFGFLIIALIIGLIQCGFGFVIIIIELILTIVTGGKFEGFGGGDSGGGGADDSF